jgi:regulator of RNase E activity RraB
VGRTRIEFLFESTGPDVLIGEIEASQQQESALMAQRCAVIAALLGVRIGEAEEADPDSGCALITGFARTTAEVSAAMNMSPMGAHHVVALAETLDSRLPKWPRCWPRARPIGARCS